jgi:hypothetical protein
MQRKKLMTRHKMSVGACWVHGSTVIEPKEGHHWHIQRKSDGAHITPHNTGTSTGTFYFPLPTTQGQVPAAVWLEITPGNKAKVQTIQLYTGTSPNGTIPEFQLLQKGNDGLQGHWKIKNTSPRAGVLQLAMTISMEHGGEACKIQAIAFEYK